VVDWPGLSVTDAGLTRNRTSLSPGPTASEKAALAALTLLIVTFTVFVLPELAGNPPKLTLTGSSVTTALTAASRSSRPAPMTLTSVSRFGLFYCFKTFWSAVFTIAERICAALQFG